MAKGKSSKYLQSVEDRNTKRWVAKRIENRESLSLAGARTYGKRFSLLLNEGFIEEEAKWFATARIGEGEPIRALRLRRQRQFSNYVRAARREDWSEEKLWRHWRIRVKGMYARNNWFFLGTTEINPYALLEDIRIEKKLRESETLKEKARRLASIEQKSRASVPPAQRLTKKQREGLGKRGLDG